MPGYGREEVGIDMMKISLDELFTDKPELVEMAKGLLEFLHLKKLPRVQDKVDAIAEKLEIMASVVGSLTEMFSGDFKEIETQFGEKTNRCKTTHILNEEYLLDQILFSNLEVIVILMWKKHHADEPVDIAGLDEKLIACRKVWGPLCDVLIDRTEGALAAIRLKEEVSDFMDSLMFVFYANKVTDDLTEFTRRRDRIKATLREITSELIKVEARKAEAARHSGPIEAIVAGYTESGRKATVLAANTQMAERDFFSDANLSILFGSHENTIANWRKRKGTPEGFSAAFESRDEQAMRKVAEKYRASRGKHDVMSAKKLLRNLSDEEILKLKKELVVA